MHANAMLDNDDNHYYYYHQKNKNKNKNYRSQTHRLVATCWDFCCRPASSNNNNNNNHYDSSLYYYQDTFNDLSWTCTAGTSDEDGIWLNKNDPAGSIMAFMVWILIGYSALTMTLLAQTGGIHTWLANLYCMLASAALACHVKTTLTDPGSVPASAVPTEEQRLLTASATATTSPHGTFKLSMCSQCQTFKPVGSHHCRICNRCISRMDHHCPWMNNCVGAGNLKHFLLFLLYTWICSVFSLVLLGWNYFFCANASCEFTAVLTQLVRIMTLLSIGAFLFTSSMLMNVVYGIMTGVGTIDRLKKKATGNMMECDEESIPLQHIFGMDPVWMWALPTDPIFPDYDKVMGYSTPQRLLREQMKMADAGFVIDTATASSSVVSSKASWSQQPPV